MSEAAATAPEPATEPAPPALVADRLADFSDKLSPMLVKELRQGLRAKTFVIVFLTLQGLLLLVLLSAVAGSANPQRAGDTISGIIFMFFALAVLVIQPVRGIGSLHREVQARTIELMVLTRLSAWKIVLGKWISIVSQSALLLAAIIPYLILRYWFGDMNLFGELSLMVLTFIASAVLTAVIIGISCVPSVLLRGLVPLIAAAFGLILIPQLCFDREFDEMIDFAAMQTPASFWGVLLTVLSALYLGWTALGIGASMIAPAAENHTTIKRLVSALLLILLIPVAAYAPIPQEAVALLVCILGIPALVLALTEPFMLLPPVCAPFLKRGPFGLLAGRVLYPGWPSGVLFSLIVVGLAAASVYFAVRGGSYPGFDLVLFSILGALLMPAAIISFFDRKLKNRLTTYLLVLAASTIVAFVVAFIAGSLPMGQRGFLWFFAWLPQTGIVMESLEPEFDVWKVRLTMIWVASGYGLLLLPAAFLRFREIRKIESELIERG
ncbi:hypothetical protein HAHE_39360 [Haloferula helveola]|uniref:ABC transporter permease n=1 Tax=Haloferula helveola TaxID=490095 RepID=A0ABM7RPN6_9BACT|nr:hypothetical protein HAHE_39360 [Haloferula helveola]